MKSYQNLLQHILENGEGHGDRTGVGTISVFGYQWRHSMKEGFPLLTTKRLPFRWIKEELLWFLRGDTNEYNLREKGVDIWKEWSDLDHTSKFGRKPGDLGPVYGFLWRHFGGEYMGPNYEYGEINGGFDQIKWLLDEISNKPNSRRLLVTGWHPEHQQQVTLPPCHTVWQIKIHEEAKEISLHLYARSIDAFLGLPFNIASYALLLSLIGHWTGYEPRDLVISFGDLHIYKNHLEQVNLQLEREERTLPKLKIIEPEGFETAGDGFQGFETFLRLVDIEGSGVDVEIHDYYPYPVIKAEVAI